MLPDCAHIVLAFGEIEDGAIDVQLRAIVRIAKHLHREKESRVWVHPLVVVQSAREKGDLRPLASANKKLTARVTEVTRVIPGVRMMNIFTAMIDRGGVPKWKPEFVFDESHLRPSYVTMVERSLHTSLIE